MEDILMRHYLVRTCGTLKEVIKVLVKHTDIDSNREIASPLNMSPFEAIQWMFKALTLRWIWYIGEQHQHQPLGLMVFPIHYKQM